MLTPSVQDACVENTSNGLCPGTLMNIREAKIDLREKIKGELRQLTEDEKRITSEKILNVVSISNAFKKSKSVMMYVSTPMEIDTFPIMDLILRNEKELWVPWCDTNTNNIIPVKIKDCKKDLTPGAYGILEPCEPHQKLASEDFYVDIVFVPGIAFDVGGNRLGRGLGYYDKFLFKLNPETVKIGLAFQCQMADKIPVGEFDFKLDEVISV